MRRTILLPTMIGISLIISVLIASCGMSPYPHNVIAALKEAGDNRAELEKVITHYQQDSDTLKLKAAYFLIGNMSGHCYVDYTLKDTTGKAVDFNPLDYEDYPALTEAFSKLEDEHGSLDFERNDKVKDLENIAGDFLINQIDMAFTAWQEKPWAQNLTFADFCDYVLPYRGSNEPLEMWRQTFIDKYKNIEKDLTDPSDPIEAANIINSDIMTWFTFDPRFYYHPTDLGLEEMFDIGLGRCEDMTNVTIYAMRANGLAVTSDYTPYWANTGNNHAWNAIVNADGIVTPFMGAESNPGKYRLANKMAKVYRKMFAEQEDNLVFQDRKQEKMPRWLSGKNYRDVTAGYVDVSDVTITFEKAVPDSVDIAYLCVFNSGEWKAIHWGRIENNTVTFTDMGTDIAYLPALFINEEIEPLGAPFILHPDHSLEQLTAAEASPMPVQLVSTTKRKQVASTDGIARTFLTPGKKYELFYWKDGWESVGDNFAGEKPIRFDDVPSGCLYWLVEKDSDREERIFTIIDGQQVWW